LGQIQESVDGLLELDESLLVAVGAGARRRHREGWTEGSGVEADVEVSRDEASLSEPIAVGFGDAFDETVQAQSSQVIGHLRASVGGSVRISKLDEMATQVAMSEAGGSEGEEAEGLHQGEGSGIIES
jgi:hypothetical protein